MEKRTRAAKRGGYHHGDLRNALLQAALKLVAKKGVEGFSLREAARGVGVSAAAAYRHFDDKWALLAGLAIDGLGRLAGRMGEAVARVPGAPGTPARAVGELAAIGTAYVEFAVEHPSQFRVMFGPWCERLAVSSGHHEACEVVKGLGDAVSEISPGGRDPYQLLVDALDGLVRAGAIAPVAREGAEVAAWSAVHGLSSLLVERALMLTAEERARAVGAIVRTLLVGLGVAPTLLGPVVAAPPPHPHEQGRARAGAR